MTEEVEKHHRRYTAGKITFFRERTVVHKVPLRVKNYNFLHKINRVPPFLLYVLSYPMLSPMLLEGSCRALWLLQNSLLFLKYIPGHFEVHHAIKNRCALLCACRFFHLKGKMLLYACMLKVRDEKAWLMF